MPEPTPLLDMGRWGILHACCLFLCQRTSSAENKAVGVIKGPGKWVDQALMQTSRLNGEKWWEMQPLQLKKVGSLNKGHSGHSQAERLQSQHVHHQMMDPPKRGRASESRLAHSYLPGIGTISCPCFLRQDSHPGLAAFHHQVPRSLKIQCLPVKSPWYPTYIGFGASYLTFFVWFWCWNFHFGCLWLVKFPCLRCRGYWISELGGVGYLPELEANGSSARMAYVGTPALFPIEWMSIWKNTISMVYLPKNNMKLVILGYPLFSDKPISDTQLLGNQGG